MRLIIKLALITGIMIALTVPLLLVVSKIYERDSYQDQARSDIARSWTGSQQLFGPILVVPFTRFYEKSEYSDKARRHVPVRYEVDDQLFIVPQELNEDVQLNTEIRYRGIYEVPVYSSTVTLGGTFSSERIVELGKRSDIVDIGSPYISVGVSDERGIATMPLLTWNSNTVDVAPGSRLSFLKSGVHAQLESLDGPAAESHAFSMRLDLRGMSSFRVAPLGDTTIVDMTSEWPHPRFDGLYLPASREVSDAGFTASWRTSAFATDSVRKANDCADGDCSELLSNSLGVELIDPVDVYLQAQRASKYGILFVGLTFAAFFLYEVLKSASVHPIQYALVGMALTIFYLLLTSLAEHIAFATAYLVASIACCGLQGFYVSYVLKSRARGLSFAASLGALYAMLYIIIQEEDFAFLMGAALMFAALAGIMIVTRHIDWSQLGRDGSKTASADPMHSG